MDYREKLRRILAASGLTQQALAAEIGASLVSVSSWLTGKTAPTRKQFLQRIDVLYGRYVGLDAGDPAQLADVKRRAAATPFPVAQLLEDPRALRQLIVASTYNSNTIEGSTMTASDVDAVLYSQATLRNRSQVEQREAVNHRAALEYLLGLLADAGDFEFTPDLIQRLHLTLMVGILSNAGYWRDHGVRIQGSRLVPANHLKIPYLIDSLCAELNQPTQDPVALLARTHARFEQIHPFSDGNGRVGRLIMLAKALQLGLTPPVVAQERKRAYYTYLERAQTQGEHDLLEQFIAESMLQTL